MFKVKTVCPSVVYRGAGHDRTDRGVRIDALVVFLDRDLAVGLFVDPVMGINVLPLDTRIDSTEPL